MAEMGTSHETSLRKRLRNRVRYFNRQFFNPFALSFAGRPNSFWSVILHVRRRSGKAYTTPTVTSRHNGGFAVPLPYGRHVDWLRNVMASGACDLIYMGRVYHASDPEIIPVEEGLEYFAGRIQSLLRGSETEGFLRLNEICMSPDDKDLYQSFTNTYPLARWLWVLAALGFFTVGISRLMARRT